MINYIIIILVPTILYFVDEKLVLKKGLFKKIAIAFLIIISSLRYGFGADYFTYSAAFERIQNGIMTDKFEWGYTLLNIIIGKIGLPFQGLLFIIACFNLILLYKSIEEHVVKDKWLSIFLYLAYFDLFFYSLSAIRQSIVISIVLITFKYIQKRNFKKYAMWMVFGSLFHSSALFMIPIYYLYQYMREKKYLTTTIIMIVVTILYDFLINFISLLQPYISYKLQYYLYIFDNSIVNYNITYVLIAEITMISWIYFAYFIRKKNVFDEDSKSYLYYLAITFLLCLKIFQYMHYISIIPRIQMYFYCIFIFTIPSVTNSFSPKLKNLFNYTLFILFMILFVFRYGEVNQMYQYCYANYKLIFIK